MSRRVFLAAASILVVTGSIRGAGAGSRPSWAVSPTEGPSPNTIQVSGNGCLVIPPIEEDGLSFLGAIVPGVAHVELFSQDGGTELASADYPPDLSGNWSGGFSVPAGLDAGPYPMKAYCNTPILDAQGVSILAQGQEPFQYTPDRTYTVVVEEEKKDSVKAEAVEAEVTLTG